MDTQSGYLISSLRHGERIIQKKSPRRSGGAVEGLICGPSNCPRIFAPVGNNIIVDRRAFIEVA